MRYHLRTLLVVLAIAPPVLAWCFLNREWIAAAIGWAVFVAFFSLWHWMVSKTASLGDQARGKPNYDPPKYPPVGGL
jgi:hypothetical protein